MLDERVGLIMRGDKSGALYVREGVENVDGTSKASTDLESVGELPKWVDFMASQRTEKTSVRYPSHYPVLLRFKDPVKYKV